MVTERVSGRFSQGMSRLVSRRRATLHRARNTWTALGITTLCSLLPGSGFVVAGRRQLGLAVAVPHLLLGLVLLWYVGTRTGDALTVAVDPTALFLLSFLLVVLMLVWVAVLATTYEMLRPEGAPQWERVVGIGWVIVVGLVIAVPMMLGARYAYVQRDLVNSLFGADGRSATSPEVDAAQPWGPDGRVNLLLLGGDGGVHRVGIRTDTVILASMDAETGDTVLFSLPRNLQNVPFPEGSELAEIYPNGFTGPGDPLEWMLNAVYGQVPALHPRVLGASDNEGADALKMAVSGALGVNVDYYALINLKGFRDVVDAMGGVTVNINQRIPIGGNSDLGVPPDDYLEPGPDQHLDGFEALWFARGRYGLDDYNRMERQRCVVDALIDEVEPVTLLRHYEQLAATGKEIVRTDVPQDVLPAFVDLGLELKDGDVRSVVFRYSDEFDPNDPDYEWMRDTVQRALDPPAPPKTRAPGPRRTTDPSPSPSPETTDPADGQAAQKAADSCDYDPVG
ncbi:MAG: LCP family protein [Nocardioidaceae bacterium]